MRPVRDAPDHPGWPPHWPDLSEPRVMGVLNITPDSFSDGGRWCRDGRVDRGALRAAAEQMVADGAAFLDIGGESTRPGAQPVSPAEEVDRVVPVLELLADLPVVCSVDTSSPEVITAAAAAGAGLVNDVRALQRPGALAAAAATGLPVCLVHMQGQPDTMQSDPAYRDVVAEVRSFLGGRLAAAEEAGVPARHVLLDPGIGFGKRLAHNVALLRRLDVLVEMGPVLVGLSRKRMVGELTGRGLAERAAGSLGGALAAVAAGARVVRVHDVAATRDALRVWWAVHGDADA